MTRWQLWLLTAFGLGYLRPAPGTFGSLPPVALALMLVAVADRAESGVAAVLIVNLPLMLLTLAATAVCVRYGSRAEAYFGRKDASPIVADEVAGQSMVLLFLPWREFSAGGGLMWNVLVALSAFVAFRLCDIVKPPPARGLQRLPGGWGVVIDDLIAAIYAWALAHLAVRFVLPMLIT